MTRSMICPPIGRLIAATSRTVDVAVGQMRKAETRALRSVDIRASSVVAC